MGNPIGETRTPSDATRRRLVVFGCVAVAGMGLLLGLAIWYDGPPVDAPDLVPAPLPPLTPEENAYAVLTEMLGNAKLPHDWTNQLAESTLWRMGPRNSGDPREWNSSIVDPLLVYYSPYLEIFDAVAACDGWRGPDERWREEVPSPFVTLSTILAAKRVEYWVTYREGDTEGTVESAIRMCLLGKRIGDGNGGLSSWRLGLGAHEWGLETLFMMATECLDSAPLRQIMSSRNDWFHDDAASLEAIRRAMQFRFQQFRRAVDERGREVFVGIYNQDWDPHTSWDPHRTRWQHGLVKPNQSLALLADLIREQIANAARPPQDWSSPVHDSCRNRSGRWLTYLDLNRIGRFGAWYSNPPTDWAEQRAEMQARQSLLAVLVALRLHEFEHGTLPAALSDLVPDWLPEVPLDPYNGKALNYDSERRIVWSVGEDLATVDGNLSYDEEDWRYEPTVAIPPVNP